MRSTLRTKFATAALVLLPMGALLAMQPASAQERDFHRVARDQRAPAIYDVTPSQGARIGERGLTQISARFSDDRSGVERHDVVLRVDGRDVTRLARVDREDIRYAEDLQPGRHRAELQVRDRAGNIARRAWSFEVADRGHERHDHDRRW
jgi:hypothetical protein